jgi:glycosyltransferase involved in cell wall biosynthesis
MVHALRIPFEGMLAEAARLPVPLAVSIWGNDLTLHGSASAGMRVRSMSVLQRANGLAADTCRDLRMGRLWGFAEDRPGLVVPGNGGIDLSEVRRAGSGNTDMLALQLPAGVPLVVNPRGLRPGYVRNEVFFEAIPLVLRQRPDVCFVCTSMAGQSQALAWVDRLKISSAVRLLPYLPQPSLWDLFQRAEIMASISTHDGTPNTLLEAMVCGCFPIAGDLESIREWITPGVNGLLVEAAQPQSLAEAVLLALENPAMCAAAAGLNLKLVAERAEIGQSRRNILEFYQKINYG